MATRMESGPLSQYLTRAGRQRPLSPEEEREVIARAQQGDADAREALVRIHLPLVLSVARRYQRTNLAFDDLIQEGTLGVVQAIEHFDASKGTRFFSYAMWWVRAYIGRYAKAQRSQVRGGWAERAGGGDVSLDAEISGEIETERIANLADEGPGAEDTLMRAELSSEVNSALAAAQRRIGKVGWDVLHARMVQEEPLTLEQIGLRWGVSRERVRQIELKTKKFLASYLLPLAG